MRLLKDLKKTETGLLLFMAQKQETKTVYILEWTSKHGTDYHFSDDFDAAEKEANSEVKKYYPKSKNYKDRKGFGMSDNFRIYSLAVSSSLNVKDLNKLFNTILVNPNLMKLESETPQDDSDDF